MTPSDHGEKAETNPPHNAQPEVVRDFGREWAAFDQEALPEQDRGALLSKYFAVFPWGRLPPEAKGFDAGCGTGRWAREIAPRVGHLACIDPSSAIDVARKNLRHVSNCTFHRSTVDDMPLADDSMDFGYSLGVLHHVPDTEQGLRSCVRKLKKGAPFLLYLYYAFDNQPAWFRWLWVPSDYVRRGIAVLPFPVKYVASQLIALGVYWPLARAARVLEKQRIGVHSFPLSFYRDKSFYTMRTDALDRFGTRLEQRFTKAQIHKMMERAGLGEIRFSPEAPFWCSVGIKQ